MGAILLKWYVAGTGADDSERPRTTVISVTRAGLSGRRRELGQQQLGMVERGGRIPLTGHDARVVVEIEEHLGRTLPLELDQIAPDLVGSHLQRLAVLDSLGPQPHRPAYDEAKPLRAAPDVGGGGSYDVDRRTDRREVGPTAADPAVGDPAGPPQRHVGHPTEQQRRIRLLDRL